MTSADLSAELKSGKTLSVIATEKGVNLQTVQAAIQTARNAQFTTQINQAVTAGRQTGCLKASIRAIPMERASSNLVSGSTEPKACILMPAACTLEARHNRHRPNPSRNQLKLKQVKRKVASPAFY